MTSALAGPTQASEEAQQALDEGKVDQTMRKIHTVVLALVTVFAFSAVAASSACE